MEIAFELFGGHFKTIQQKKVKKYLDRLADAWGDNPKKPAHISLYRDDHAALLRAAATIAEIQGRPAPSAVKYRGFSLEPFSE